MPSLAQVATERKDQKTSKAEQRRSLRHARCLKASWRVLGARDHLFTPATVQDISRHGVAIVIKAALKQGANVSIQLEGVAERFAGPWLVRVENVRPQDKESWVIGCSFSIEFAEGELQALLQSACQPITAQSGAEPLRAPAAQIAADPFLEGSAKEQRSSPRRGGQAIAVVIARASARATHLQAWVKDRSLGGLGLAVPCPLPVGSMVKVRAAHVGEATPWTPVRVRNCRPYGRQWIVGCQFTASLPTSVLMSFC